MDVLSEEFGSKVNKKDFRLLPQNGDENSGDCRCGNVETFRYIRGVVPRCSVCGSHYFGMDLGRYRQGLDFIDHLNPSRSNAGFWQATELAVGILTGVYKLTEWFYSTSKSIGCSNQGRDFVPDWYHRALGYTLPIEVKSVIDGYLDLRYSTLTDSIYIGVFVTYRRIDYKMPNFSNGHWKPLNSTGPVWCYPISRAGRKTLEGKGTLVSYKILPRY